MGKSKKDKKLESVANKSEMLSGNDHETHQTEMLSIKKKKKKKARKEDSSFQSTLSSFISTSSPKQQLQTKSNPTDPSKTEASPKKKHILGTSNEYSLVEGSLDESSDHIRKRKINDTSEAKTSKKIRLQHTNIDTLRNTESNTILQNNSHSGGKDFSSPDLSNTSRSKKHMSKLSNTSQSKKLDGTLSPKSSVKKRGGHQSNISSDEGVDSGEEMTSVPKNHLEGHPVEKQEIDENHSEDVQPEINSECNWSKEQTEELIFMIQEKIKVIKPEDSMSYRCRVKGLNWGELPGLLHPPRTEQECKDQLQYITDNTKTVRNLYEMMRAYKGKPNPRKGIMVPLRRFMLEHGDTVRKIKGNWMVNAKEAFDALSEEEKSQYTKPYNDEMAQRRLLRAKTGRSTFKIFCETLPNVSVEEQREKFSAISPDQRILVIKQAHKEHKQSLKDFEAQHGKDGLTKHKPPSSKLTKEEWKLLLESKGMPLLRAVSPYQLFLLERDDTEPEATGLESRKNALRRYQDFVRSEHYADYELKFKQELDEFISNYKAWFGKLKEELCREHAHSYYTEVTTNKGGVRKTKSNFKVTSKVQELEQSYVESTMIGKFCDEPVPAPMTAKDVFKHFAKAKNPRATVNDLNNTWSHLPKTHKEKFTEVATNNVQEYKAKLKHYVKGLSDHERRVYIGQNRVRYIRVFEGTDIFEKSYPCSEYPPFRIPGKIEKKSPDNKENLSKLDLNFGSMFKTSSATNGIDEESESESEEHALPNQERTLSEESFKGRLPSTSTPGTVAKSGIDAAKQIIVSKNDDQEESDAESSSSESSDEDGEGAGDGSSQYLSAVQKVHSKKLLEAYSESESDESSESEEESPKFYHPAMAGRLPAPVLVTPKQLVASATGGTSSSSQEETSSSSSDENARVATKYKSLIGATQQAVQASPHAVKASPHAVRASPHAVRASPHAVKGSPHAVRASPHAFKAPPHAVKTSPHHTLSTKTTPQHLSPKKQKASSNKTATPSSSKLLQQTPKVAAQRQAESTSSESSDSEEESSPKKKPVVTSALGRMKPSLPPQKDDSSSEDDDDEIVSAWA